MSNQPKPPPTALRGSSGAVDAAQSTNHQGPTEGDTRMYDDLDPDSAKAKLEINARGYHYDPTLDPLADKIEQGPAAWKDLPAHILGVASVHKDLRDAYRRAVAAGAIPDDRNADTHQEK